MSKETHKSKLSTQGSFLPQAVPRLQQKAAQRLPDGIPVYLVTPTWYLSHRSIQFPLEHTETSNIHILRHEIPEYTDTFSKGSPSCVCSASAISSLQLTSFDSCTGSACEQSFCSHPLPGIQFNRHLLYPPLPSVFQPWRVLLNFVFPHRKAAQ